MFFVKVAVRLMIESFRLLDRVINTLVLVTRSRSVTGVVKLHSRWVQGETGLQRSTPSSLRLALTSVR